MVIFIVGLGFHGTGWAAMILTPSLSVSERYNDNVFFNEINRQSDSLTVLNPQLEWKYDTREIKFTGRYRGDAEFYRKFPEADRYGQTAYISLEVPSLSKGLEVRVTESVAYLPGLPGFSFRPTNPNVPGEQTNEGVLTGRIDTFRNDASLTVGYGWTPRLKSSLIYLNLLTRYKGSTLFDSDRHLAGVGIDYALTRLTTLTTFANASRIEFYGVSDRVMTYQFLTGINHQLDPNSFINGRVGVTVLNREKILFRPSFFLEAVKNFKSANFFIRYSGDTGTGGGLTAETTYFQRVTSRITKPLGERASTFLQFGYANNTAVTGSPFKIISYEAGAGIEVGLLSWLDGSLSYSYINQKRIQESTTQRERHLASLMLTATAPDWMIWE